MAAAFRRYIGHNFTLKVLSLMMAVGLWWVISHNPPAEVELKVPIEFHNLPEKLEIDSATFTEAQVRVRGPERLIRRLRSGDVRVLVDLTAVHPGSRTFDLTPQHVRLPNELEVVQVLPGQFQLSFDERSTRSVEVRPRVTGSFAGGMQVAQVLSQPPNITITGPKRRVDAVEAAITDPVDATGAMTRATFVTQAYVPDPLIQVVQPQPIHVTVIMEHTGQEKK